MIGVIHPGLLGYLLSIYKRVIISDWNKERSENNRKYFPNSDITLVPFEPGKPPEIPELVDLVLSMWSQRYLGDPAQWMKKFSDILTPRGTLKVVEKVSRQMYADQQLTDNVFNLRLKLDAARGINLHPGCDHGQFISHAKSCSLTNIRAPIYTDQDLLMDSSEWEYEADSLITVASPADEAGKLGLTAEFVNECINVYGNNPHKKLSTPPFTVVSGIKRTKQFSGSITFLPIEEKPAILETESESQIIEKPETDSNLIQKLRLRGADNLSTEELLEIAIESPASKKSEKSNFRNSNNSFAFDRSNSLANRIISEYGSRAVASETNPSVLAETMQISLEAACKIVSIFALGKRFYQEPVGRYPVIRNEEDVYHYLHDMKDLKKEHLRGLYFNVQMRLIHDEVISIGTLSRAIVHPREVFAPALEYAASSVILAHNHPSGDINPSEQDITLTRQLSQAGRIMGIELTDHIIIGADGYTSMKVAEII